MSSAAFAVPSPTYPTKQLLISSLTDHCLVNSSGRGRKSSTAMTRPYQPRESRHRGRPRLPAPLTIMLYSLGKRGVLGQRAKPVLETHTLEWDWNVRVTSSSQLGEGPWLFWLSSLVLPAVSTLKPQTSLTVGLIQMGTFPSKAWVLMTEQLLNENIHLKNSQPALTIDRLIALSAMWFVIKPWGKRDSRLCPRWPGQF